MKIICDSKAKGPTEHQIVCKSILERILEIRETASRLQKFILKIVASESSIRNRANVDRRKSNQIHLS